MCQVSVISLIFSLSLFKRTETDRDKTESLDLGFIALFTSTQSEQLQERCFIRDPLSGYLRTSFLDLLPYERRSSFDLEVSIYSNCTVTLTMAPGESVQLSIPLPVEEGADWSGLLESGNSISQFTSVSQSCPAVCNPVDYSTTGFPVHHQLPGLVHNHVC